jgi:basic amino acid/polyamine antiporter, APA family
VMVLRKTDPSRRRPFRTPGVWIIGPLTMAGCIGLYFSLPLTAILVLPGWGLVGLIIYFFYSRKHSHVARGIV